MLCLPLFSLFFLPLLSFLISPQGLLFAPHFSFLSYFASFLCSSLFFFPFPRPLLWSFVLASSFFFPSRLPFLLFVPSSLFSSIILFSLFSFDLVVKDFSFSSFSLLCSPPFISSLLPFPFPSPLSLLLLFPLPSSPLLNWGYSGHRTRRADLGLEGNVRWNRARTQRF